MTRISPATRLLLGAALAAALAGPTGAAPPREVKRIVAAEAAETAVPPSLALAVASVESGFRDDRESPEGARGVMQITPEVAQAHGVDPQTLWDARANTRLGLRILGELFRDAGHQWPAALERYAAAIPGGEDGPQFARRVLSLERRFAEEIVVRSELEQRKREVLNVAEGARFDFAGDDAAEGGRRIARDDAPWPAPKASPAPASELPPPTPMPAPQPRPAVQLAAHGWGHDLGGDLQARLAAARRSLDDFAAGRIPDELTRGRRGRSGR